MDFLKSTKGGGGRIFKKPPQGFLKNPWGGGGGTKSAPGTSVYVSLFLSWNSSIFFFQIFELNSKVFYVSLQSKKNEISLNI